MAGALFHVKHRRIADVRATTWQRPRVALMLVALLLAACSAPNEVTEKTAVMPEAPAAAATPPAPPPRAPAKVEFTDNEAKGEVKRDFNYSWPAEVSAIPELAAQLTAERDRLLAEQKNDWEGVLEDFAGEDCTACASLDFAKGWEVVANIPRFLSLSSDSYAYTGGAHGNYWSGALVWDRETTTALDPKTMFRSQAALQDALGAAWCKALTAERAKRIGAEYAADGFFPCPPIADLAVLVGSSDRKSFNRIGLIAAPYVAGSYAEGAYELTFPVTPAVLAAVKPEYRAAFALGK